ncbi:head maturation protease, ClpP-related [Streptomyces wuyuanensis]|uniref:head maturation protease, ClpP-related n=1 Tax=Streptomyces wuyuanensis TaxID=1196353 RepID=UPI0037AAB927
MRSAAGGSCGVGMRGLGPLPRGAVFASAARPVTADAQRVFLAGVRGGKRADIVVDNVVSRDGGQGGPSEGAAHPWYRITNVSADEADVLIYDEISWFGVSAEEFVSELRGVTARQLNVRINSPGGSVFDGITIANAIMAHPANVTVYVDGLAASIASVIALAGDRVVMMPRSQMMIHDASGLCIGNAADMRDMVDLLDKQSDNIAGAYAERAGGTPEEWRGRMQAETWYSAEEAVAAGLADEVAPAPRRKDPEEPAPAMRREEQLIRAAFRYRDREHAPAPVLQAKAKEPAAGGVVEGTADVGEGGTDYVTPKPGVELRGEHGPELVALHIDGNVVSNTLVGAIRATAKEPAPDTACGWKHSERGADGLLHDAPCDCPNPTATAAPAEPAQPVEEPDPWASLTAHLTETAPDPWAALVAHLTDTPSSSAATHAHA